MDLRPNLLRGAALCLSISISTALHAAVDLYDVDEVTFSWEEASGPVVGYYVVVSPSGDDAYLYGVATGPNVTLRTRPGDQFAVQVMAFDKSGSAGPLSRRSELLRIHPGTGGEAPPDGGDDPPPDDRDPGPKAPGTPYDFDGDGVSDLLVRDAAGATTLWRMDGGTVLAAAPFADPPASSEIVGGGDYDGDGIADLLWENLENGELRVWLLRAGTVHQEATLDTAGLSLDEQWHVGASGDFNGDRHDDIVLFSRVLGEVEILYMRDGATHARARMTGYSGAWSVDGAGDFDGDGTDEIVVRDEMRHELALFDPNGGAAAAAGPLAAPVTGWRLIGSGDFDGDGRADLFAEREAPRSAQVWSTDGTQVTGLLDLPTPSAGQRATHVGDYDFDGLADLVWSDPLGGDIEIWFSDGDGVTAETVAGGSGASLLHGEEGSDDSEFRARLCDADLNDDGAVDFIDLPLFSSCLVDPGTGDCQRADMDADGVVGHPDFALFLAAFQGMPCGR
jgi:hypothetical protein